MNSPKYRNAFKSKDFLSISGCPRAQVSAWHLEVLSHHPTHKWASDNPKLRTHPPPGDSRTSWAPSPTREQANSSFRTTQTPQ